MAMNEARHNLDTATREALLAIRRGENETAAVTRLAAGYSVSLDALLKAVRATVYRVIIKGTVAEAQAALDARGIFVRSIWPHLPTEVHAYVMTDHATLTQWFCENPHIPAPFPPATLLHFTNGKG